MPNVRNNNSKINKSFVEIAKAQLLKMPPKMTLFAVLGIAGIIGVVLVMQPRVASIVLNRPEPIPAPPPSQLPPIKELPKTDTKPQPTKATNPPAPVATGNATVTGDNNTVINNSTVTGGVGK